jgi:putative Mg2+ transporter-C (MgtC) family protein
LSPLQQFFDAIAQDFADFSSAAAVGRTLFRLAFAAALGAMLGYERESRGKAAGLRTHMLVAVGASLLVMAPLGHGASDAAIARVIQGVIAGIGFLGAGAIVKGHVEDEIAGLTTAATIWTTAALGIVVGLGRAGTALAAALLALVILQVFPTHGPPHARS